MLSPYPWTSTVKPVSHLYRFDAARSRWIHTAVLKANGAKMVKDCPPDEAF